MTSTITTLTEYAQGVLNVSEDALNTTDAGAPIRVHLDASPPAFDCCPFLSVHVASLQEAPTSPIGPGEQAALRATQGSIILATYLVTAVRCAAVGDPIPDLSEVQAVAVTVEQDGWALWNGLRHATANGILFDRCTGVHFDGGRPIPSQGGCVGWQFAIRAMVPGIENPGPSS